MTSDKTEFMELLNSMEVIFLFKNNDYNAKLRYFEYSKEIKQLFLKHYNISEDEILAMAKAIRIKRWTIDVKRWTSKPKRKAENKIKREKK